MTRTMLRFSFYCLYGIGLTAILLYVRFPTAKFIHFCEKKLEQVFPSATLDIGSVRYTFPFSVTFAAVEMVLDGGEGQSTLLLDSVSLSAKPPTFWKNFSLKAHCYNGTGAAELRFEDDFTRFSVSGLTFDALQLGSFVHDLGLVERTITGITGFTGEYRAALNDPLAGEGKGQLNITLGNIELLQPILSLDVLTFERISADFTYSGNSLQLINGDLQGSEIGGQFAGTLTLSVPLRESSIIISGGVMPDQAFLAANPREEMIVQRLLERYQMETLPFKVGGTLALPTFRFSR